MQAFVNRLLHVLFVMLGVSVVVFALLYIAPGDAATTLLGPQATEEAKEILREELGLNKPMLVQYYHWISNVLQGDFGTSIVSRNPVLSEVIPRYLASLLLAAASLSIAVGFGLFVGILAAAKRGSIFDRLSTAWVQIVGTMPPFLLGLVLVYFFALTFRLLPATGMRKSFGGGDVWDIASHLVLPAITAAAASSAVIVGMARASFIEVLGSDYITVAVARGVGPVRLLFKHALPNCLPAILNIIGLQLGYLIGGVLFTEVVFAWPGIGQLLYQAILGRDVAVVQACVLFIALTFVVINLSVDIATSILSRKLIH
jgi:peptide/nickel transport system permease protein